MYKSLSVLVSLNPFEYKNYYSRRITPQIDILEKSKIM
jgi:hypothetical protein